MDAATVTLIIAGIVTIIGSLVTGIIKVLRVVKENTNITVAGQTAISSRGKVRDKKIQEIHILTNSRLTAALKLIALMAKKEYDRTKAEEDRVVYESAVAELNKAMDATEQIIVEDGYDIDVIHAKTAEEKLANLVGLVSA